MTHFRWDTAGDTAAVGMSRQSGQKMRCDASAKKSETRSGAKVTAETNNVG